jgi:hypothetical protein
MKKPASHAAFPKGVAKPAIRALASAGVTDVEQLTRFTEAQLLELHGMGPTALAALKKELHARGLSLAKK